VIRSPEDAVGGPSFEEAGLGKPAGCLELLCVQLRPLAQHGDSVTDLPRFHALLDQDQSGSSPCSWSLRWTQEATLEARLAWGPPRWISTAPMAAEPIATAGLSWQQRGGGYTHVRGVLTWPRSECIARVIHRGAPLSTSGTCKPETQNPLSPSSSRKALPRTSRSGRSAGVHVRFGSARHSPRHSSPATIVPRGQAGGRPCRS
jgi:hypothetical protein